VGDYAPAWADASKSGVVLASLHLCGKMQWQWNVHVFLSDVNNQQEQEQQENTNADDDTKPDISEAVVATG
jgi:hypothetical protein